MVEDARPQLGGNAPDLVDGFVDEVGHRLDPFEQIRGGNPLGTRQSPADPRDVHLEARQDLAELVVDLARNAAPLFFAHALDPFGQRLELLFHLLSFDGDVRGPPDELEVPCGGCARLAVIKSKRAEDPPVVGEDRGGPARSKSVLVGYVSVIVPQRVDENVGYDHGVATKHRRPARARVRSHAESVDLSVVRLGQARRGARLKVRLVGIENQDRRHHAVALAFDAADQGRQRVRELAARRDHLERAINAGVETLAHAFVGHVAAGADEPGEFAVRTEARLAQGLELSNGAVRSQDALGVTERCFRLDGLRHGRLDALAIFRNHAREKIFEVDLERLRFESVNAIELVGPGDDVRSNVPVPAADVSNLLSARELLFASNRSLANEAMLGSFGVRRLVWAGRALSLVLGGHSLPAGVAKDAVRAIPLSRAEDGRKERRRRTRGMRATQLFEISRRRSRCSAISNSESRTHGFAFRVDRCSAESDGSMTRSRR